MLSARVSLEMSLQGQPFRVHPVEAGDEIGWLAVLMGRGKHVLARALEPVEALSVVSDRLQAARMQLLDVYSPIAKKAGA